MSNHYILNGRETVPVDLMTWARWLGKKDARRVRFEQIGESLVSTVFLGLDHSFGEGPPLLFETLVFGGPLADEMERCTTYDEAEAMHESMCAKVRAATGSQP